MVDRLLRPLDARKIDLHAVLSIDQDLTRVLGGKLLDRRAAAGVQRLEELPYSAGDGVAYDRSWHVAALC